MATAKMNYWAFFGTLVCAPLVAPLVGILASDFYIPYADSDAGISRVFEIITAAAFVLIVVAGFWLSRLLGRRRSNKSG